MENKEVKKESRNGTLTHKHGLIIKKLQDYPEGLKAHTLSYNLSIPRRTMFRLLKELETEKLVYSTSGIWQCQSNADPLKLALLISGTQKVQGHKISFVLDLIEKPIWWEKRENRLLRIPEAQFKSNVKWGNTNYQTIVRNNYLLQMFPNSIVFIPQKKYWGLDVYDCFQEALQDAINVLNYLEERFKFKFFKDSTPHFRVKSNHYVSLRDALAEKCKKENNSFLIEINGKERITIDLSSPFGVEAINKDFGVNDISRYRKQVEDFIINNPPTNSELANRDKQNKEFIESMLKQNTDSYKNQMILMKRIEQIELEIKNIQSRGSSKE